MDGIVQRHEAEESYPGDSRLKTNVHWQSGTLRFYFL